MSYYSKLEDIHYRFTDRYLEVDDVLYSLIVESMVYLPDDVIEYVIDNISFRSGNTFTPKDSILEGGIITLDDSLTDKETVLHEIAHAYLKHKVFIEKEQNDKQEIEATELSKKWLNTRLN